MEFKELYPWVLFFWTLIAGSRVSKGPVGLARRLSRAAKPDCTARAGLVQQTGHVGHVP